MPRHHKPNPVPGKAIAYEDKFARAYVPFEDRVAKGIAAELGPLPGAAKMSERDERAHYNYRDPNVDVMALQQQVQSGQMTPDQATRALYPRRADVILYGAGPDPRDQIAYAKRMARDRDAIDVGEPQP